MSEESTPEERQRLHEERQRLHDRLKEIERIIREIGGSTHQWEILQDVWEEFERRGLVASRSFSQGEQYIGQTKPEPVVDIEPEPVEVRPVADPENPEEAFDPEKGEPAMAEQNNIEQRLRALEDRQAQVDAKFDSVNVRLDALTVRISDTFQTLDVRLSDINSRIDDMRSDFLTRVNDLQQTITQQNTHIDTRINDAQQRFDTRVNDVQQKFDTRINDVQQTVSRQNTYMTIWFTILGLMIVGFGFFGKS